MTGYASLKPTKNEKGVWYLIEVRECPVCGRSEEHRTRMAGPPPLREQRYIYEHAYDYCDYG